MDAQMTEGRAPIPETTALLNPQLDYAPLADLVQANLDGQRLAAARIADLKRFYADPDMLYLTVKSILPETLTAKQMAALRGLMRGLQKTLEVSA